MSMSGVLFTCVVEQSFCACAALVASTASAQSDASFRARCENANGPSSGTAPTPVASAKLPDIYPEAVDRARDSSGDARMGRRHPNPPPTPRTHVDDSTRTKWRNLRARVRDTRGARGKIARGGRDVAALRLQPGTAMHRGILLLSLAVAATPPRAQAVCSDAHSGRPPLNDLGPAHYNGAQGGLYPGGSNVRPLSHDRDLDRTSRMVLLDAEGSPDPVSGIFLLISIGNSNATEEFTRFVDDALADPSRNRKLAIVDCAESGQTSDLIRDPAAPYWSHVDGVLLAAGVTPAQVQSVWLKDARPNPTETWPDSALVFEDDLRAIVQVLKSRYPSLKSVYHTSRIY